MKIAVCENVEAGTLLITDDDSECILKFLPEADVEHAGVQRTPPHRDVKPARAGERAGGGAGQDEIGGRSEHGTASMVGVELAEFGKTALGGFHFGVVAAFLLD